MRRAIALDLGGTQTRAAVVGADGTVSNRVTLPTPAHDGPDAVVATLVRAAQESSVGETGIIGIGLSSPGPIDTTTGICLGLPTFSGMDQFPLRDALAQKLGQSVLVENDGIAAAIGEWQFGAGRGLHSLVYVTVSTGIGGGVIVDGHVLRGRRGMAGHIGHMSIMPGGARCNCGNTGCWEAYAAGPALAARANRPLTELFAAARAGEVAAQKLVDEEASLLGLGLTSLLHLYSPDGIIIGGGLSNAFGQLHPGIAAYVAANAMPAFRDVPIVKAALGGNSGLVGAAALVFGLA